MGIPVIVAPCEAEAECAALCKSGKVYATATEDMDALTFGTKVLLRGFNSKKEPIIEINYDDMLKELGLTHEEFVDLCILCGCDYTETIDGVGPATAYKLIKEHKTIENVLKFLESENEDVKRKRKYVFPEPFYYNDARELFFKPELDPPEKIELKWDKPNEEELKKFLCDEKGFNQARIENAIKKIKSGEKTGG